MSRDVFGWLGHYRPTTNETLRNARGGDRHPNGIPAWTFPAVCAVEKDVRRGTDLGLAIRLAAQRFNIDKTALAVYCAARRK